METSGKRVRKKLHKQMTAAEVARRWSEWRQSNAGTLSLLQIPEIYLKREDYWRDFLMHGCLHLHTDPEEDDAARAYSVNSLSIVQARAFFTLIQGDYPDGWSNVDYVIHRVYEMLKRTDQTNVEPSPD